MTAKQAKLCDTLAHSRKAPAASSAPDARAVKSGQALQRALLALLERKTLEQITIREIATEAGVSYATFFRHHAAKKTLLDRVAADQISRLVALTLPVFDSADGHTATLALFAYVGSHRTLWTTLLTGGAAGAMREELLSISRRLALARAPKDGSLPVDLAVNYCVSLIFETLAWWLAQPPESVAVEQLAATLSRLLSAVQPGGFNGHMPGQAAGRPPAGGDMPPCDAPHRH